MEKLGYDARFWINSRQIAAFGEIAVDTGQREVAEGVVASMLPRPDVLDLERGKGRLSLEQSTILAAVSCSGSNQLPGLPVHYDAFAASTFRACARRIATNLFACTYPAYSARSSSVSSPSLHFAASRSIRDSSAGSARYDAICL